MKLNYITIMVRDIEKSITFYQELVGLKIIRRFNPGAGEIAFLSHGESDTMLEVIQIDGTEKVSTKGMVFSFEANEKLEILRDKAIKQGYAVSEVIDRKPKPKHFRVIDPDGLTIEFSEKE